MKETAMPPKSRVTRQMVADASFEVIRESGHEKLNARTIAETLNCSTQPVLYNFRTVDEIREAAYEVADQYHTAFIMPKDPFSSRTRRLRPGRPMVLCWRRHGRAGGRQIFGLIAQPVRAHA